MTSFEETSDVELAQRLATAQAFADDTPAIARVVEAWGLAAGLAFARCRKAIHAGDLREARDAIDELIDLLPDKRRRW